eukprot:5266217-Pyramimonas_sp.AAC.1
MVLDHPAPECHCARLRVYVAASKKAAIERGTDRLTPREFQAHAAAVAVEVLQVWVSRAGKPGAS